MKSITRMVAISALVGFVNCFAGPVDINTADAVTLARELRGVGQKKAEMIVAYRNENGAFKSPEELVKVSGIGRKLFEMNQDNIVVKTPKVDDKVSDNKKDSE